MNAHLAVGIALLASGLLGGWLASGRFLSGSPGVFRWLLTFCGGLLFSTAILHLLPEVLSYGHPNENLWLLGGFFMQWMLEKFSAGIEHGHMHSGHDHRCDHPIHPDQAPTNHHEHSLFFRAGTVRYTGLILSLSLHGLVEGIPLAGSVTLGPTATFWSPLLLGILLHKAPTTFALTAMMIQQKARTWFIVGSVLVVASMTPMGMFMGYWMGQGGTQSREVLHALMALATGSFLQIASTILYESSQNHRLKPSQAVGALLGALVALAMGHPH
ncbi:MAG: ZIP family metal transporter [Bacteroidota bacterium]|jgi:zinc transporter ZupT